MSTEINDDYDISSLKKKKKKNSRAKGSTFERDIAKLLNKRFNTSTFARTPGSGAFASTHTLPEHLQIHGDLITPANFKYCLECKKGYNKESLYSLFNYSSDTWKFIEQAGKDAKRAGKVPMVIFKQDRREILAIVPSYIIYLNNLKSIEIQKEDSKYRIYLLKDLLKEEDYAWID
jgi:Holliday junction resolvase